MDTAMDPAMRISAPLPSPAQVQVKFVTRDAEVSVPSAPILVPTSLKRYGLSQIVNHLLSTPTPTPFDFLASGAFLRSSLDSYLTANGLSSESVLVLEYVRAVVPPRFAAAFQHDDWVSSVAVGGGRGGAGGERILSGSYDGITRVWDLSGTVLAQGAAHTGAVKAARWIDDSTLATASMDRTVRIWACAEDTLSSPALTLAPTAELLGHTGTVENIATHAATCHLLSASTDTLLGLWSTTGALSPPPPASSLPPAPKKRRTTTTTATPQFGPLALLPGHTAPVSAVRFDPADASVAYSVSWDHTLRSWDLPTQSLAATRTLGDPLLSLCPLRTLGLLACGSVGRTVTLHDPRAPTVSVGVLRGHGNAVSALAAAHGGEYGLVSASHDATVRVWDVRAVNSGCVFTIKRERGGKVFDVEWSAVGIVSGGEDKAVQINDTPRAG